MFNKISWVKRDVWNKPYIIIGAITFLLLLPLAVTSFKYWMIRLGKKWKRLHKLVYVISHLAVVHFLLVVKASLTQLQGNIYQPQFYSAMAVLQLTLRIPKIIWHLLDLRKKSRY